MKEAEYLIRIEAEAPSGKRNGFDGLQKKENIFPRIVSGYFPKQTFKI